MPPPGVIDVAIMCAPCPPYSIMRDHSKVSVRDHELYDVLFGNVGSVVSVCITLKPRAFLSEQVMGFLRPHSSEELVTPMEELFEKLKSIGGKDGEPHFTGVGYTVLNSSVFVPNRRERYAPNQTTDTCGMC